MKNKTMRTMPKTNPLLMQNERGFRAFALAGGYVAYDLTQLELADLYRLTIEAVSVAAVMPLQKAGQP